MRLFLCGFVLAALLAFRRHYPLLFFQLWSLQSGDISDSVLLTLLDLECHKRYQLKYTKEVEFLWMTHWLHQSRLPSLATKEHGIACSISPHLSLMQAPVQDPLPLLCVALCVYADNKEWDIHKPTSFVLRTSDIRHAVNSKLIAEDVASAVCIVTSDDSIIEPTPVVFDTYRMKHPSPPLDRRPAPSLPMPMPTDVFTDEVSAAHMSFRPSSSGSIDGLRLGHLKYLTCR